MNAKTNGNNGRDNNRYPGLEPTRQSIIYSRQPDSRNGDMPSVDPNVATKVQGAIDFLAMVHGNHHHEMTKGRDELVYTQLESQVEMLEDLRSEKQSLDTVVAATPERIDDPAAPVFGHATMEQKIGLVVLWLIFVFTSLVAWVNTARFALDLTQDWLRAFLYTSALPCIPLALKYFIDATNGNSRKRANRWLAAIGALAAISFIGSYAWQFAVERSLQDLQVGGTADLRVQLSSQLVLEVVISSALFLWINRINSIAAVLIRNPHWDELQSRRAMLVGQIRAAEQRAAELRAEMKMLSAALAVSVGRSIVHGFAFDKERDVAAPGLLAPKQ